MSIFHVTSLTERERERAFTADSVWCKSGKAEYRLTELFQTIPRDGRKSYYGFAFMGWKFTEKRFFFQTHPSPNSFYSLLRSPYVRSLSRSRRNLDARTQTVSPVFWLHGCLDPAMAPINLINLINLRLLVYLHQVPDSPLPVATELGMRIRACTEYPSQDNQNTEQRDEFSYCIRSACVRKHGTYSTQ